MCRKPYMKEFSLSKAVIVILQFFKKLSPSQTMFKGFEGKSKIATWKDRFLQNKFLQSNA